MDGQERGGRVQRFEESLGQVVPDFEERFSILRGRDIKQRARENVPIETVVQSGEFPNRHSKILCDLRNETKAISR